MKRASTKRSLHARRLGFAQAAAVAGVVLLAGCAAPRQPASDAPTLASLAARHPPQKPDAALQPTPEAVIAAYRAFIDVAVDVPQRAEALRRLGDLEMDSADRRAAEAGPGSEAAEARPPDYGAARARYEEFLRSYPQAPKTDRVLYQLARAQEQAGELDAALRTLTRLVDAHPGTVHVGEAQFRRGELLFAAGDYAQAEAAYDAVLRFERRGLPAGEVAVSPLAERSRWMQGWSLFKLNRGDEALTAFFEVLDARMAALPPLPREETALDEIRPLARAERELIADTLRIVAVCLAQQQGIATLSRFVEAPQALPGSADATTRLRQGYRFRVHQALAALYLQQQRVKDAADALQAFVRVQPLHPQAPQMLAQVAQIYDDSGYPQQALLARREQVRRYGAGEPGDAFRRAHPTAWRLAQQQVQADLQTLARHHHAASQQAMRAAWKDTTKDALNDAKSDASPDSLAGAAQAREAEQWWRQLLAQFPQARDAAASRFLLAELLFENRRWADAVTEYERVAYDARDVASANRNAADAGYAALLARAELEARAPTPEQRRARQQQSVLAALRYAQAFGGDTRTAAVLLRAATQLQALGEGARADAVARRVLAAGATTAQRVAALDVIAQQALAERRPLAAEQAWTEALALPTATAQAQAALAVKLAGAIFSQAEQARAAGDWGAAAGHFDRVAAVAALPADDPLRPGAAFDAASAWIALQDWPAAARALQDFRRRYPGHALQSDVAPKLAPVYEALRRPLDAAAEYDRIAAQAGADGELARSAHRRGAEVLFAAAAADAEPPHSAVRLAALQAGERYLQRHPQPLESAVDVRWQLAELCRREGANARADAWLRELQQADAQGGDARTERTRTLGGRAALALAQPLAQAVRAVPLVEPLARQLKLKKARFEEALQAYAGAAQVGVTEIVTAATFHSAALYRDFGRALLDAPRPKKLDAAAAEQYGVMLEEQAFPFEEQAIALFEANAGRAAAGVYDRSVRDSYDDLARLKPARWGKAERVDAALPSEITAIEAALQAPGRQTLGQQAALLNQRGVALRREGRFDEARRAYETALSLQPAVPDAACNLAILHDLYLGDAELAMPLYQRCVATSPAGAALPARWLLEVRSRKAASATPANAMKEAS